MSTFCYIYWGWFGVGVWGWGGFLEPENSAARELHPASRHLDVRRGSSTGICMRLAGWMTMRFLLAATLGLAVLPSCLARTVYSLDSDWRFALQKAAPLAPCPAGTWTIDLDGQQTMGLQQAQAIDELRCAETCCSDAACETYQFCNSTSCGSGPPQQPSCWVGKYKGAETQPGAGWYGKARRTHPAPAPPPSPSPHTSCAEPWCEAAFDDSGWRSLAVPHDFVVEGTFSPEGDKSHGYLLGGVGLR
jgi:hypothetical protein